MKAPFCGVCSRQLYRDYEARQQASIPVSGNTKLHRTKYSLFRIHISLITIFYKSNSHTGTFRWPCGLGLRSEASRLLGLRIRIPPMGRMFVCCVCCALCRWRHMRRADHSFRGVLPGVCVCVCLCVCACVSSCMCDQGISTLRQPMPEISCCAREISHRKRRKLKM